MSKSFIKFTIVSLGALLSISCFAASSAQDSIGVVDMQQILHNAPQMKKINADLKKKFAKRQGVILKQANKWKADMEQFSKNRAVLSTKKLKDAQDKIASEEAQLRTAQMAYQQDLAKAQNAAMGDFLKRLKFSVTKVASSKKLNAVFPKNALLYSTDANDITGPVLASLDSK